AHQADMLRDYVKQAVDASDVALQLPTGSGKTLVGLLIGEGRRRNFRQQVAYLCPTRQLANQVVAQGRHYGGKTESVLGRQAQYSITDKTEYLSADVLAVTTYSAIFNTNSFFGDAGTLICDDAHAGENYVSKYWSVLITRKDHAVLFDAIVGVLKQIVSGS